MASKGKVTKNKNIAYPNIKSDGHYDDKFNMLSENGITGLKRFGNFVVEDFLTNLQGKSGAYIYKEMSSNDATIGAVLNSIEMLIRNVNWNIEAAGETPQDEEAREFLESCFKDMSLSWSDTISEILTMITYGWAYMEVVYKKRRGPDQKNGMYRSKYHDNRIGWRKWSIRAQETLYGWDFDDDGSIRGMIQQAPPDFRTRFIPIEKSLLFRTKVDKNNPEGRSILRPAYRDWYLKKNIEEIEAVGIERDLAGLPIAWLPPEIIEAAGKADADEQAKKAFADWKKTVANLKNHQQAGLIMPLMYDDNGRKLYDITLLSSITARKQYDTNATIMRFDKRIAMSVMADFLLLGNNSQGSFALSSDKTNLFKTSLNTYLKSICDVINTYAIPRLFRLNDFNGLTDYPRLSHGMVDEASLKEISEYVSNLASAGVLDTIEDVNLEDYAREIADLPSRPNYEDSPTQELDNGLKYKEEEGI